MQIGQGKKYEEPKRRIKKMLKEKDITQKELGELLCLTQGNISRNLSENNTAFFTVEHLMQLSEILNCSIDYILTGVRRQAPEGEKLNAKQICSMLYSIYESCPFNIVETEPRVTLGEKYPELKKYDTKLSETPCLSIQFEKPEASDPFGWSDPVGESDPARSIAVTKFLDDMRYVLELCSRAKPEYREKFLQAFLVDVTEESDVKKMLEPPLPF